MQIQQNKRRVYKTYFTSLGQLSVLKCGIKGLAFRHIYELFAMAIIKQRTMESAALQVQWTLGKPPKDDNSIISNQAASVTESTKAQQKADAEGLGNLLKL